MPHKFTIGQTVHFRPGGHDQSASGLYVVTKRLPEKNGEFQYRIKPRAAGLATRLLVTTLSSGRAIWLRCTTFMPEPLR
jgi:hypothetical protein